MSRTGPGGRGDVSLPAATRRVERAEGNPRPLTVAGALMANGATGGRDIPARSRPGLCPGRARHDIPRHP
jgi:hypothetical protein